jgi:hypothetical protein
MKKILYLHGFSSAGSTGTATNLRNHLYADYGVTVVSPDIPVSPAEAVPLIKKVVEEEKPDLIIGTSMGAMYTELLHGHLRICVNPSFHMAKLLTFKHLGKNVEFQNKRADGQKQFKVDKQMIAEFKEIETKQSLKNITPEDKQLIWGIFGKDDPTVNCRAEFKKAYGDKQMRIIEGEHSLTDVMMKRDLLPLIKQLLEL